MELASTARSYEHAASRPTSSAVSANLCLRNNSEALLPKTIRTSRPPFFRKDASVEAPTPPLHSAGVSDESCHPRPYTPAVPLCPTTTIRTGTSVQQALLRGVPARSPETRQVQGQRQASVGRGARHFQAPGNKGVFFLGGALFRSLFSGAFKKSYR